MRGCMCALLWVCSATDMSESTMCKGLAASGMSWSSTSTQRSAEGWCLMEATLRKHASGMKRCAAQEAQTRANVLLTHGRLLVRQGMIQPEVPAGTQASVFAVFDDRKKLQFVGFSKDVRNSLRTVFSRRPDRAFFYKRAPAVLLQGVLFWLPCPTQHK